jgi:hypothetical protein
MNKVVVITLNNFPVFVTTFGKHIEKLHELEYNHFNKNRDNYYLDKNRWDWEEVDADPDIFKENPPSC